MKKSSREYECIEPRLEMGFSVFKCLSIQFALGFKSQNLRTVETEFADVIMSAACHAVRIQVNVSVKPPLHQLDPRGIEGLGWARVKSPTVRL